MEYRWNINKIRQILFNSKMIYMSTLDPIAKVDNSMCIYQAETALSFLEDDVYTTYPEIDNSNEMINEGLKSNKKDIEENTNLAVEFMYNKNRKVYMIEKSKTIISPSKTIELIKDSYPDKKILISNLIKSEQLLFTSDKIDVSDEDIGSVIYFYPIKYPLVFARRNNTCVDTISLSHELGHVEQYQKTPSTFKSFINQQSSYLTEISSTLAELKMIESLKGKINEKDRLSLLSDHLYFIQEEGLNYLSGKEDKIEYLISGLVSTYLFVLYKNNRKKYNEIMKKFYSLVPTHSDLEIIESLDITLDKIDQAYDIFYENYKEEVSKIKKII